MGPPTRDRGKAGEEARTTTKSPPHRPAQPIFHHKRKMWTAIASCDNWPLLRRLLIWTKTLGFPTFQLAQLHCESKQKITRSSATLIPSPHGHLLKV